MREGSGVKIHVERNKKKGGTRTFSPHLHFHFTKTLFTENRDNSCFSVAFLFHFSVSFILRFYRVVFFFFTVFFPLCFAGVSVFYLKHFFSFFFLVLLAASTFLV